MNEIMIFFSNYRVNWLQILILVFVLAVVFYLLIKKLIGKRKSHWTDSVHTHSKNQVIKPLIMPSPVNYDSMITEDVNNFLRPKVAIEDPRKWESTVKDYSKLMDKPIDSVEDTFSGNKVSVINKEVIKEETLNSFSFLDSFNDDSKLERKTTPTYPQAKPSKEILNKLPVLTEVVNTPKVDSLDSFSLPSLPSLPNLTSFEIPVVPVNKLPTKVVNFIKEIAIDSVKTPSVSDVIKSQYYKSIPTLTEVVPVKPKPESIVDVIESKVPEKKLEFINLYHAAIGEALYWDSQGDKDSATKKLVEATKLIENSRVSFYLKVAIHSYKNSIKENSLPAIINQFYVIEKEKLMKEKSKK